MPINKGKALAALGVVAGAAIANPAVAQIATDNVLASSDDAFGTTVGLESTGIYTDSNTRGFSPLDAGNVRIDGIYFDQVSFLTNKLKQSTSIRVGFSAVDTPFVAPTGVVENRLRSFAKEAGNSLSYTNYHYGGVLAEWEFRLPLADDKVSLAGGIGISHIGQADGSDQHSWGVTIRPIIRVAGFEFSPFYGGGKFSRVDAKPLAVVTDGYLPDVPAKRLYLGQDWERGKKEHGNYGATFKGPASDHLYFRGGIFNSVGDKESNFTDIYLIDGPNNEAKHYIYADPPHDIHSTSGEALFVLHYQNDKARHRFYAGFRGRNRYTETGGADLFVYDSLIHGTVPDIPKPEFEFTPVNEGRVRQSSWMLAYVGMFKDIGHINLGVQKAQYKASLLNGITQETQREQAEPWLYNAAVYSDLMPGISAYLATQKGLEDSGLAPSNAANRDEQLPATISKQIEGGLRWNFGKGQLVVSAFQITKPYYSFDAARDFVVLGDQRHRGLEFSLAGHFTSRFDLLLGAVLMDPKVTGPGREAGLVGSRPAGVPKLYSRMDANYRTDLPGELIITASVELEGERPATAAPIGHIGGEQLMLPSFTTLDIGTRQVFRFTKKQNLGVRLLIRNLFDAKAWHVSAPDVLLPKHRRSFFGVVSFDF